MTEKHEVTEGEKLELKIKDVPFIGRDLLESYLYYMNIVPKDSVERYNYLIKSVTFGMELLPKEDGNSELYKRALKILKDEIPSKRSVKWSYTDRGDKREDIYKVEVSEEKDAKDCEAKQEDIKSILEDFRIQQHEQHIPKLQVVNSEIMHILSEKGIVPKVKPTFDNQLEDILTKELKEM